MLARLPLFRQCFAAGSSGRVVLDIDLGDGGSTQTRAVASGALAGSESCIAGQLASMHAGGGPTKFRVVLTVVP